MPFHFCIDELLAIMMLFPFIGMWAAKVHTWYHIKFGHKCHDKTCNDTHVVHSDPEPISDPDIPVSFTEEEVADPFSDWRSTHRGFVAGYVLANGPITETDLLAKFATDDTYHLKVAIKGALTDGSLRLEDEKLVFGQL